MFAAELIAAALMPLLAMMEAERVLTAGEEAIAMECIATDETTVEGEVEGMKNVDTEPDTALTGVLAPDMKPASDDGIERVEEEEEEDVVILLFVVDVAVADE